MSRHTCPYPGCMRQVGSDYLACGPHWLMLPLNLRNAIWRAWRAPGREGHAEAVAAAIEWYEAQAA